MKNIASRILIGTVALGSLAVAASAQTQTLAAKINFDFQAGSESMPAGKYFISPMEAAAMPAYKVVSNKSGYMFLGGSPQQVAGGETPKLVFNCVADKCVLTQFSTGTIRYSVPHKKLSADQEARMIQVPLGRKAD